MNDWQPARLVEFHERVGREYSPQSEIEFLKRQRVMVRPITVPRGELRWIREECDCPKGTQFFEIRDDFNWEQPCYVCVHEILTD